MNSAEHYVEVGDRIEFTYTIPDSGGATKTMAATVTEGVNPTGFTFETDVGIVNKYNRFSETIIKEQQKGTFSREVVIGVNAEFEHLG